MMLLQTIIISMFCLSISSSFSRTSIFHPRNVNLRFTIEIINSCPSLMKLIIDSDRRTDWDKRCMINWNNQMNRLNEHCASVNSTSKNNQQTYLIGALAYPSGNTVLTQIYHVSKRKEFANKFETIKSDIAELKWIALSSESSGHYRTFFNKNSTIASNQDVFGFDRFASLYKIFFEQLQKNKFDSIDQVFRGFSNNICLGLQICDSSSWQVVNCQMIDSSKGLFYVDFSFF